MAGNKKEKTKGHHYANQRGEAFWHSTITIAIPLTINIIESGRAEKLKLCAVKNVVEKDVCACE